MHGRGPKYQIEQRQAVHFANFLLPPVLPHFD